MMSPFILKMFTDVNIMKDVIQTCGICDLFKEGMEELKSKNDRLQNMPCESVNCVDKNKKL